MAHTFINQAVMDGKKIIIFAVVNIYYTFTGILNRLMGQNGSNFTGLRLIFARNSPQCVVGAHGE